MITIYSRIDQKANSRNERTEIREKESDWKREEREKQKDGKEAFYRKKASFFKYFLD